MTRHKKNLDLHDLQEDLKMCSFLAKFKILLSMRTQKCTSKIAKILQRYFLMHVLFVVISNLKFEKK